MTTKLDLVLINPASRKLVYQALANELAAIEPPVWAGLMAAYARGKGLSVVVIDAEGEALTAETTAERVEDLDPHLVAVVVYGHQPSASTQNMPAASTYTHAIKQREPERRVLLVGGHVAALPQRTLSEEVADFVCDGEGPVTLVDLTNALRDNGDLSKVRGLWFREAGLPRYGQPAPLVSDLDAEMPGVAWDLLPMEKYRAHNWHCFGSLQRQPYAAMYTTLGCPYHCTFCCIQAPFKNGEKLGGLAATTNSYRRWSPEAVIRDIDALYTRYGVRNIKIADEMFVLHPKHVIGICDQIIARGYDLNIWAYARVDTVRDGMIDKLRRAGFRWLALGVEAGSAKVRDEVDKGFDQSEVYATIRKLRSADINVIANYIFGLPEDDLASMQSTLDLAVDLNCEFANFYSAMAYPGSPLYRTALERGWALPETWNGYSQHAVDTLPLPTKHLAASDVLRFRDQAFHAYFTSPSYLQLVETRFGGETAEHVRKMTAHRLERKFAS
jgi:radical SAM superfamily enzyme YgiQ (UPF0313 family)